MTTQSAISGQSFGTSTNIGNGKFSISPLTLAATTTAFVVNAQWTNGAGPLDPNARVKVWYTTTMRTVTSGTAVQKLGQTARFVELFPAQNSSELTIKDSTLEPVTGSKLHVWVDAPTLPTAATLSVDVVELP